VVIPIRICNLWFKIWFKASGRHEIQLYFCTGQRIIVCGTTAVIHCLCGGKVTPYACIMGSSRLLILALRVKFSILYLLYFIMLCYILLFVRGTQHESKLFEKIIVFLQCDVNFMKDKSLQSLISHVSARKSVWQTRKLRVDELNSG